MWHVGQSFCKDMLREQLSLIIWQKHRALTRGCSFLTANFGFVFLLRYHFDMLDVWMSVWSSSPDFLSNITFFSGCSTDAVSLLLRDVEDWATGKIDGQQSCTWPKDVVNIPEMVSWKIGFNYICAIEAARKHCNPREHFNAFIPEEFTKPEEGYACLGVIFINWVRSTIWSGGCYQQEQPFSHKRHQVTSYTANISSSIWA